MLANKLLELMYIAIGLIILYNAYGIFINKENNKRVTSALFWFILGLTFILPNLQIFWGGKIGFIPPTVVGYSVVIMALLSLFNSIKLAKYPAFNVEQSKIAAKRISNVIFIPALLIGILSFLVYWLQGYFSKPYQLGSIASLGVAIIIATIVGLQITKDSSKSALYEGRRLLDIVGPMSILPQVLAALGGIFTTAGVGHYISNSLGAAIPPGAILLGVSVYVFGMVIFTMIMGNAFAAFAVITAGIGVPFVILQGGDPVYVGALGMTAGFCGTLLTPMAANFNIVPTSILEMENRKWGIIKYQLPVALVMIILHIIAIYVLAF